VRSALLVLLAVIAASPPGAGAAEPPRQRQGPYEATLMLPAAGLYAGEEMEIEFKVLDVERPDGSGAPTPLTWGELLAEASMPSMPSMAAFSEIAHREGIPGVWGVHPTFPHGGDYRLCITLVPPAAAVAGRPSVPLTFEFPLTVWDAASSPTPVPARIRPFTLELTTEPREVVARRDATLDLAVRMNGSRELREVTEFDVQHERLMHLFIVRDDLRYFAHEHPERVGPGDFRLRYRFPAPGRYRVYADVAPKDAGAQVLTGEVLVSGVVERDPTAPPPRSAAALALPEGGVPAGRTVTVTATVTDPGGAPAGDIQPWLGAMGHLLLVSRDGSSFAHAHPDDRVRGVGDGGVIPFLVRLPTPGAYKGWLQVQRSGRVDTVEVEVEATRPY
jgi:hypothetical protein